MALYKKSKFEWFWRLLAQFLYNHPDLVARLIAHSQRTPYYHLDGYMNRWWTFNPYDQETHIAKLWWLPVSARIHHILRCDDDRHLHDHPWDARTIILRGWYTEERECDPDSFEHNVFMRRAGDTASLRHGEYHIIRKVSSGGVWTLFITFGYQSTWGFKVNGTKIPHREYLGIGEKAS